MGPRIVELLYMLANNLTPEQLKPIKSLFFTKIINFSLLHSFSNSMRRLVSPMRTSPYSNTSRPVNFPPLDRLL